MSKQDTHKVEKNGAKTLIDAGEDMPLSGKRTLLSGRHVQFWLFCILLGLALISMGVTQATEGGGALYWLILLWVYALVSLTRAWVQARKRNDSVWRQVHQHVFHWLGTLVALHIIFMLERHEILARDAASDVSLVILALASFLAGLHFERLFVLLGIILAIMAVVGAFLEQYTLWLIVIPVSLGAVWLFLKSKFSSTHS